MYPQFTTIVLSSIMTARSSHRQSSGSLTLPENCQNTVRVSSIPCHISQVVVKSSSKRHVISKASSCHIQSVVMSSPKPSRSIARPSSSLVAVSQLLFHYVGSVMTSSHHYRHLPLNRLQALFQIASEMSCVPSSRSEGQ